MERPIRIGDHIDCEQTVLAFRTNIAWKLDGRLFALDGTIYDKMCDMETLWSKFPRVTLRNRSECRFGGGESKEGRTRAKRGCRAGEENGSSLAGVQTGRTASRQTKKPPRAFCRNNSSNSFVCVSRAGAAKLFPTL
jgi:hypothetical protein